MITLTDPPTPVRDEVLALTVLLRRKGLIAGDRALLAIASPSLRSDVARACWQLGVTVVAIDPRLDPAAAAAARIALRPDVVLGDAAGLRVTRTLAGPRRRLLVGLPSPVALRRLAAGVRRWARREGLQAKGGRAPARTDARAEASASESVHVVGPDLEAAAIIACPDPLEDGREPGGFVGVWYSGADLVRAVHEMRHLVRWRQDASGAWDVVVGRVPRAGTAQLAAELLQPGASRLTPGWNAP